MGRHKSSLKIRVFASAEREKGIESTDLALFSLTVVREPRQVMAADEAATFPCPQGTWATQQPSCIAFILVQLCTLHQILLEICGVLLPALAFPRVNFAAEMNQFFLM